MQSSTAISSPTKQSSSRHHHSHHNKHSKSSNQRVGIVDEQDDENDESNNRLTLTSVSSAAVSSTSGSGASGGGMGAVGSSAVSSSTASPSETLTNSANSLHLHRSASQVSSGNIMPNYMTNTNMGPVMYVPFVPLNSQFLQQPSAAAAASASHHMAAHMSAMASVNGSLVTPNIPGYVHISLMAFRLNVSFKVLNIILDRTFRASREDSHQHRHCLLIIRHSFLLPANLTHISIKHHRRPIYMATRQQHRTNL